MPFRRRSRQLVELQPRTPSDGYNNDLFFGPGGQMIDIDQQNDAYSGNVAQATYQSADVVGQSSQTFAFNIQPSSEGLVVPLASSSNIISPVSISVSMFVRFSDLVTVVICSDCDSTDVNKSYDLPHCVFTCKQPTTTFLSRDICRSFHLSISRSDCHFLFKFVFLAVIGQQLALGSDKCHSPISHIHRRLVGGIFFQSWLSYPIRFAFCNVSPPIHLSVKLKLIVFYIILHRRFRNWECCQCRGISHKTSRDILPRCCAWLDCRLRYSCCIRRLVRSHVQTQR